MGSQLLQGLHFDLPYCFSGDAHFFADGLEGIFFSSIEGETVHQDLTFFFPLRPLIGSWSSP
jgi:hypothetical protein